VTALKKALETAGFANSKERLRALAVEAFTKNTGDLEKARSQLLAGAEKEGLLLELFRPWTKAATNDYLSAAAKAVKTEGAAKGQIKAVEETAVISPKPPRLSNFVVVKSHLRSPPNTIISLPRDAIAPSTDAMSAVRGAESHNLLITFKKIDGIPLTRVSGGRARSWAREHKRDGRFVELVAFGVPDSAMIGQFRTPQQVWKLYDQARAETSNV